MKHRVALIDVDADFMEKHQIPGVPHLRLYKSTGEQIEMLNKVYDEYPMVVMMIRNFIAEQTYDESIGHPCQRWECKIKVDTYRVTTLTCHTTTATLG